MARTKIVAGPNGSQTIELTAAENAARDAEEQAWADGANDRALAQLRNTRDQLLKDCDDRFLADAPAGRGNQAWKDYRQALRDLPANTADPADVTWPTTPL
jgi:hypothetical protein